MPSFETEAVILRCYDLADADRIVVALTRDHGLVRGVAKGAKRLKSRFGSALEPFSVISFGFFQKEERELVSVTRSDLIRSYFEAASEPAFLEAFSYAAELLQSFAPPHDPNPRLYDMTRVCLDAASDAVPLERIVVYFELWLLKLLGFLPSWNECSGCGREAEEARSYAIAFDFRLQCTDCSSGSEHSRIGAGARACFAQAQRMAPERFSASVSFSSDDVSDLSGVLRRMIARILNRELKGPLRGAASGSRTA